MGITWKVQNLQEYVCILFFILVIFLFRLFFCLPTVKVHWKGMVRNDDFVLKKVGADDQYIASISSKLKEKGSTFIGRYETIY